MEAITKKELKNIAEMAFRIGKPAWMTDSAKKVAFALGLDAKEYSKLSRWQLGAKIGRLLV